VRPEHLDLGEGPGPVVPVVVSLVEHLGRVTFVYGNLANEEALTIEVTGQYFVDAGTTVPVHLDPARCHLFDTEGHALKRLAQRAEAA
jgi:multiple sugar transport system ATP-binding protein